MALELSKHFQAPLVLEYAREYLDTHGHTYGYEDFLRIAAGQKIREDEALAAYNHHQLLVLDTDFIVIAIWSQIVFNRMEAWIAERAGNVKDRLWLVLTPEIDWDDDGMREYPDLEVRWDIHHQYVALLEKLQCPFCVISGNGDHAQRLAEAIQHVNLFLKD